MGMALGGKAGPKHDINITPYIDILLVLLIIFMVITPVHQMDLDVKVPQPPAPDAPTTPSPDVIVVSVGESAQIAINQETVDISALGPKLQDRDMINKGVKAFTEQKYPQAAEYFQKAIELDPEFRPARMYLATAYSSQYIPGSPDPKNNEMADRAIAAFRNVLELQKGGHN